MRIVYLYQYFRTRSMPGGTRAYEQARRLVERGHEVHVVTSDSTAQRATSRWRTTVEDGIQVHWLPTPYSNSMSFRRRIWAFVQFAALSAVKAVRLRGDIVLASSTPLTIAVPGLVASTVGRARFVFEVRDLWPELPIAVGALNNPLARRVAFALARLTYRRADHVVALSPGMADCVAAQGCPRDRISIVPNACDLDLFTADPQAVAAFRAERPWLQDRPLVVYVGTFGRINGVGYLVRVAAEMATRHPDVRFLLIGGGKEREELTLLADELGVLDVSVFFMPTVVKQNVPTILGAATIATSVFLPVPEMAVNSANKFFDSLAAGRPQAINYGGWQAEILAETGAGVVLDPQDVTLAAKQLAAHLRDDAWLAAAGSVARRIAAERFSRDDLVDVLCRAVLGPGAERPVRSGTGAERESRR